ncbi:MAG: hypothetical protein GF364_21675 [Candidatus Lokiarchaeota archaeon]|nr:hypothetical protein [Candidatus Lokiarchaeota archaeon]
MSWNDDIHFVKEIEKYLHEKFKIRPSQITFLDNLGEKDTSRSADNRSARRLKDKGFILQMTGASHKQNKSDYIENIYLKRTLQKIPEIQQEIEEAFDFPQDLNLTDYLKISTLRREHVFNELIEEAGIEMRIADIKEISVEYEKHSVDVFVFLPCSRKMECKEDQKASYQYLCPKQEVIKTILKDLMKYIPLNDELEFFSLLYYHKDKICGLKMTIRRT